jgi:hypothetical protein
MVLAKALFPYAAKIFQAWNEFPVQECWSHNTSGHQNKVEEHVSLGGKGFRAPLLDGIIPDKPKDC